MQHHFCQESNCYCCAISFFSWMHSMRHFPYGDISPHQWPEASPEVRISVLSNFVVFQRVVEITFESCHPVRTWSWHHLALYKVPRQSPTPGTMNWNSAVKGEKFWRNSPKVEGIFHAKWLHSDFQETFFLDQKDPSGVLIPWLDGHLILGQKNHQLLFGRCQVKLIFWEFVEGRYREHADWRCWRLQTLLVSCGFPVRL